MTRRALNLVSNSHCPIMLCFFPCDVSMHLSSHVLLEETETVVSVVPNNTGLGATDGQAITAMKESDNVLRQHAA